MKLTFDTIAIDELKQLVNTFKNVNGSAADQNFRISSNSSISNEKAYGFMKNFDFIAENLQYIDRILRNEARVEIVWKQAWLDLKALKKIYEKEGEISYDDIFSLVKSLKMSIGNLFDECTDPSGNKYFI